MRVLKVSEDAEKVNKNDQKFRLPNFDKITFSSIS